MLISSFNKYANKEEIIQFINKYDNKLPDFVLKNKYSCHTM